MKWKRNLLVGAVGSLLLLVAACSPIYADGPYHGKVIDKETKQPIEGAAVLAVWWKETAMIGHPIESVHDVQETLTDQDGNFTIPGTSTVSLNPFSRIHEPVFTIFKPGYEAIGNRRLKPPDKGERIVLELGRLKTREEKLRNMDALLPGPHVPEEKYPNLIRLRNIERVNLGLKPTHVKKGEKQ